MTPLSNAEPPVPVFVLGISQRSGTNYLYQALLVHPHCTPSRQPGEDYLLHDADLLSEYVKRVASHWNPDWDVGKVRSRDLESELGQSLLRHLRPDPCSKVFVSKTPSVRNLGLFGRFLPNAKVLVLVRDGRDVAESGVGAFGWTYGEAFQYWESGARELLEFLRGREKAEDNVEIVYYEKLISDPETEVSRALGFCGLDSSAYDFEALRNLSVYGSSSFRGGAEEVHWRPVKKTSEFRPVGQWNHWDPGLRREYDRRCGQVADELGYGRGTASHRFFGKGLAWLSSFYPNPRDS